MFSERLKSSRQEMGLTLEQLAEKYNEKFNGGLNKGTLSKYENNKQEPMVSVVSNLATILHVSIDYLLGNVNEPFFHLDNERIIKELNSYDYDSISENSAKCINIVMSPTEQTLLTNYRELNQDGQAYINKQMQFANSQADYKKQA